MDADDFPTAPGTYLLILSAEAPTTIVVGKLGACTLGIGSYAYAGSALGPGGLRARLSHHLVASRTRRWHIDYVTAVVPVDWVAFRIGAERLECPWVKSLLLLPGASVPLAGVGSSDCAQHCPAHFLHLPGWRSPTSWDEGGNGSKWVHTRSPELPKMA